MSWLKIDDGFAEHPKLSDLSDRSFRLHVAALCYCARNLTDGVLSPKALKVLAAVINAGRLARNLSELTQAKVWISHPDGSYSIYGYLEHNPSAEEVKAKRDERRAAGLKGAASRWGTEANAIADAMASAIGAVNSVELMPPYPDPTHEVQRTSVGDSIEAEFHALRLYREVRQPWQTDTLKRAITAFAHKLPPAEFQSVIDSLTKNRRSVKDEGKYVMSALEKRLTERRAAA